MCPDPNHNYQKRDRRLNYFGNAIVVKKGSKDVTCLESECIEDSHCDADRKCCKNRCGGMVCTRAGKKTEITYTSFYIARQEPF